MDKARESVFQQAIVDDLTGHGWLEGKSEYYHRGLALYPEDLISYVRNTQQEALAKLTKFYGDKVEQKLLERAAVQMDKHGALHVLRHGFKDRGTKIKLCQFKPDHGLNPKTLARYQHNRLRVVQEVSYSPHTHEGYNPRLDLVLFVNGVPVATLELKSEFKQAIDNAKWQYKKDRPPKDPKTRKIEPLLAFGKRALVHFAVSQEEVWMTTRLAGHDTFFLPFNKGNESGAGNPPNPYGYATDYLWKQVFQRDAWLDILGRFVHLQKEEDEDWQGKRYTKESLIFPRFHQWDAVNKLVSTARAEGAGQRYLIQHSAGSGKSNSIAWVAHRLASLYDEQDQRVFDSVIVITDRTVLDDQLQETIYQFEHAEGVVARISREEGEGSKSSQLAEALTGNTRIIIVTIQTFPYVLEAIHQQTSLKDCSFAVIADEAHSSQTGATARKLRQVLMTEQLDEDAEISAEDVLDATLAARSHTGNISYFAFTATPKAKTLQLFGRVPDPSRSPSAENLPEAFHVYTMQQAIEEGFILDVLRRYTTYSTAFKLEQQQGTPDEEVDKGKAATKLYQWLKLHPYNIEQKVQVIVEHFRQHVAVQLNGQAKAMVVTDSRKAAVRYKLALDKYVTGKGYRDVHALVAFSGDVEDKESGPQAFNERNMNPGLKGRDLRDAFDTDEYQVMIVANKFQTGFDQPKLCAMYVDKKLNGVDCVQTLSRLNRTYPGKEEPFVLDFVNKSEDVLEAFKPYYRTAELENVSDPNLIYDLQEKLQSERIFRWEEVEAFATAFFDPKQTQDKLNYHVRPAVDRYKERYRLSVEAMKNALHQEREAQMLGDEIVLANAKKSVKAAGEAKSVLDIFRKDLGSFVRFYEFISQVVSLDDADLEKMAVFAKHLRPLLRQDGMDRPLDLFGVELTHYRLTKQGEHRINLREGEGDWRLPPGEGPGGGQPHDPEKETLAEIIARLNDLFAGEGLSDKDRLNYLHTIKDKVLENGAVVTQIENNTPEQVMLGDFPDAVESAVMDSLDAHNGLAKTVMRDGQVKRQFAKLLLDTILSGLMSERSMKEERDSS
ncbi:restriction endonuclease subunit R [Solemya velum gill symbiont]|uniref:type I restriction endonuclease subunit R n=1 Tax=Solemya velum gill symbiont TaxID=2340 RepID=UPI000998DA1D|nr:type I restriction endonuclease [Solemya velum gill symbiont]OOZ45824.1 restriction endonuclease subunit R [Solemya velum gill symbiont]OOZ50755.1 restriction endonuclease subunit R [Solemya velum gill symbiont]OOZ57034.1 restriction endonuclease subunit R [Solemya velum gill symbiont]OOZ62921.1 restriction endonuclease subunit R [Solemya velum gill symbiont]OOZ65463.1 restriction endonuclease subunit R [Solemya velum gill symbiont]